MAATRIQREVIGDIVIHAEDGDFEVDKDYFNGLL